MSDSGDDIRILCVDDEPRILEGIERTLGMTYDVTTAGGGAEALALFEDEDEEPFALTISDMRMPGMDGASYLAKVSEVSPDTVRMLLTGQSDMEAAIRAINQGRIFRFLTKPCGAEVLGQAVEDALAQHRLITSEKQLLQKTLFGCIKVLTELLSLSNPLAYNHGRDVNRLVKSMAGALKLGDVWQLELAVMLAHLGYVGVKPELLRRSYEGKPLEPAELEQVTGAARTAHSLLEGIPRLEVVMGIVERLSDSPPRLTKVSPEGSKGRLAWGAHVILTAARALQLSHEQPDPVVVLEKLKGERQFDPRVIDSLVGFKLTGAGGREVMAVNAAKLKPGMLLIDDALSSAGVLLVKGGQEVTETVIKLLRRMADRDNLKEPLKVGVAQ